MSRVARQLKRRKPQRKAGELGTNPAIKGQALFAQIDLVEWLKMRKRMSTRTAILLLHDGVLKLDSHKLTKRFVPADYRGRIVFDAST